MADDEIERLRREVVRGDVLGRERLLHLLHRAGRPLGQAWSGEVAVAAELPEDDAARWREAVSVLAALDPLRCVHSLRSLLRAHAVLRRLGDGTDRRAVMVGHGPELMRSLSVSVREEGDDRAALWEEEPWRWRDDQPAPLSALAASADGALAAAITLHGELRVAAPADLVAGRLGWTARLKGPARALGFAGGLLVVVGDAAVHRFDAVTGAERGDLALPIEGGVADVSPSGLVLLCHQARLACLDPASGAVRWIVEDAREHAGYGAHQVAAGADLVAVCADDVGLWSLASGKRAGRVERTTRQTTWEDPESTMGMGRDTRVTVVPGPDFVHVAWVGPTLATVDRESRLQVWRPTGTVARRVADHGLTHCRPTRLAGRSDGTGAVAMSSTDGDASVSLWGPREVVVSMPVDLSAMTFAGRDLLLARIDGVLVRVDPRNGQARVPVRLSIPGP